MSNVPKLRFKADDGSEFPEWEEKTLKEVTSVFKSGKTIKSDEIKKDGPYPVYGGNGIRGYANTYNHDGIYAVIGRQGALCGNIRLISGKNYLSEHAIAIQGNDISDTIYLSYLLDHMRLGQYSDQGAQPGLAVNKLIKLKSLIPSIPEQRKIANFLSTIDEIIAKSRAEVETWEKQKKGVIKKLFSQEVRFKADDGSEFPEWKEKKIRDILTIYHGKDYKNLQKGIFPVLGTGGEITRVNQFLCDWPCVVIGRKGTINKPMFIDEPFWSVDTLFYTKNKEGFLPKWEYYLFQNIDWTRYNEASGVPSLNASTINNIKILSPTLPEQQKIADCLSSIDEVIKKCKKELAAWEELKKGLLQQMFI